MGTEELGKDFFYLKIMLIYCAIEEMFNQNHEQWTYVNKYHLAII